MGTRMTSPCCQRGPRSQRRSSCVVSVVNYLVQNLGISDAKIRQACMVLSTVTPGGKCLVTVLESEL